MKASLSRFSVFCSPPTVFDLEARSLRFAMSRTARIVLPGLPHHITQRGARRMQVFFEPSDYQLYRRILRAQVRRCEVEILAYCLMPNHVHLVAVPASSDGLARALGTAHQCYAEVVNRRRGWRGHLWQERFWSFPLEEAHLYNVTRYVLENPVRAGLSRTILEWRFSSAGAQLKGAADALVRPGSLGALLRGWDDGAEASARVRAHSHSGLPMGSAGFVAELEARLGRSLQPPRRGRPPKLREPAGDGARERC